MERNAKYLEWLRQAGYKHQEQIALLVLFGSMVTDPTIPFSDVDCYFVPKTEEGLTLAQTAIIEGVSYRVFPLSWQRLEEIAQLKLNLRPLLEHCQILYADTLEDLDKFLALQKELEQNLRNKQIVLKADQNNFAEARTILRNKLLELTSQFEIPLNEYSSIDDFLKIKEVSLPKAIEFKETSNLSDDEIFLRLNSTAQLNELKGYVPSYYFQIVRLRDGMVLGQCDLRVGYNAKIELGGNIGYTVYEPFRGRGTAARACNLLAILAREHQMKELIITVRPDNIASIKTCLNLGAVQTKEIVIPPHHELARVSRTMNQYKVSI